MNFGIDLYKGNPYNVPPLIYDDVNTLNPAVNPAFDFCEAEYFMAYRDGKPVGRIAAIINHNVNRYSKKKDLRFGFFDFIDDMEVSKALLDAAIAWGKEKGMEEIVGPLGFTDMDYEGMLVEGFDQLSTMVTIYNYPYYPQHMEKFGFEKKADWVEFKLGIPDSVPEKHARISEIVKQKYGLKVVKYTNRKKAVREIGRPLFDLVNEAYAELFEFSQLTDRQIDYYIKMYIGMLNLDLLTIIKDSDDNLVGIGVAIPSLSRALQKANGHLFPFGWYHILRALYFNKTDKCADNHGSIAESHAEQHSCQRADSDMRHALCRLNERLGQHRECDDDQHYHDAPIGKHHRGKMQHPAPLQQPDSSVGRYDCRNMGTDAKIERKQQQQDAGYD